MSTKRSKRLQLIGVVHASPLPGSPRFPAFAKAAHAERTSALEQLLKLAMDDARALVEGGCDALIVENFGDAPFFKDSVPSETIAALTLVVDAVQRSVKRSLPIGVNVLRNDVRAALGIAAATGANFVRVNVHVGAAVTDQGLVEGRAAETLRERLRLCPTVGIWADVHVKHASPLGQETIAQSALDTHQRGLADALIVSGAGTGQAPDTQRVTDVRTILPRAPIYLGSGVTIENARDLLEDADGAIVGTALKCEGRVELPVEVTRVRRMRRAFDEARGRS
ncbi:MAG: BtpA/SgcQ family protein [Planctomycetota bacterium]|nr:BtpA/SgcQ family protein [Planctomycetota bacterium]